MRGGATYDKAFITRCSTSSLGSFVSFAMILNGSTRSLVGRLNTLSIKAIKQIFCRRKGKFSSRIGCTRLPGISKLENS